MPSEGNHVISVSATGISLRKAYYSDYGNGYVDVAAPGGDVYDTPTTPRRHQGRARRLPGARSAGRPATIDADGDADDARRGQATARGGTCAYYQYLQGTSMASPHATGVAALIVGKYGLPGLPQRRQDAVPGRRRAWC